MHGESGRRPFPPSEIIGTTAAGLMCAGHRPVGLRKLGLGWIAPCIAGPVSSPTEPELSLRASRGHFGSAKVLAPSEAVHEDTPTEAFRSCVGANSTTKISLRFSLAG